MRSIQVHLRRSLWAALAVSAFCARPALAQVFPDFVLPSDPILVVNGVNDGDGSSGAPPANEQPFRSIDNTTTKYLHFLDLGSGFTVTPSLGAATGGTILTGLTFFTANDSEARDPASYLVEGSTSGDAGPFTVISQGDLALPSGRNPAGQPLFAAPNKQTVTFPNDTPYLTYRVTFPTLKNAAATNSMQIGEVDFIGEVLAPAKPGPFDVTQPTDPILLVSGVNDDDTSAGEPPANESIPHIIDDSSYKHLNFLDLGSGFIVTPQLGADRGGTLVNALRLITANDAPERDPASYLLEGSLVGPDGPWTTISSGDLALPIDRNVVGIDLDLPGLTLAQQTVAFPNDTAYLSYRVTFPTLRDAAVANSMQIAEVELLGSAVPEPGTLGLLAAGSLLALVRRRRS